MATLTIEVDQEELSRAAEAASSRGRNLHSELANYIGKLASSQTSTGKANEHLALIREAFRLADENPTYLDSGIPNREERNKR